MALLRSNACMTLQRMTEVHDYKYQQLHGQLGHVWRVVGLEMAFYLKGKAVCHLHLVTVFADFFIIAPGGAALSVLSLWKWMPWPHNARLHLESFTLMLLQHRGYPSCQFNLYRLPLLNSLVIAHARTHFPQRANSILNHWRLILLSNAINPNCVGEQICFSDHSSLTDSLFCHKAIEMIFLAVP